MPFFVYLTAYTARLLLLTQWQAFLLTNYEIDSRFPHFRDFSRSTQTREDSWVATCLRSNGSLRKSLLIINNTFKHKFSHSGKWRYQQQKWYTIKNISPQLIDVKQWMSLLQWWTHISGTVKLRWIYFKNSEKSPEIAKQQGQMGNRRTRSRQILF